MASLNPLDDIVDETVEGKPEPQPEIDMSQAVPMEKPAEPTPGQDAQADEEKRKQEQIDYRLSVIKADKELMNHRLQYALEASGIERYRRQFVKAAGMIDIIFATISQEDLLAISHQLVRDYAAGRWAYDQEMATLTRLYRLVCSIETITIRNPHKKVEKLFMRSDWAPSAAGDDLGPRKLLDKLQSDILATNTCMNTCRGTFELFEQELDDLGFLLENDPDFFYEGLVSNS